MPQMGVSVAEGTVVAWRVEVGDRIAADQTICEISTDKIDTEVPAPVTGVVAEILVAVEETVSVGTVLARIAREGEGGCGRHAGSPEPAGERLPLASRRAAACRARYGGRDEQRGIECGGSATVSARAGATRSTGGTGARSLLPGRPADRRRARDRSLAGRRNWAGWQGTQAGRARVRGERAGATAAHREPVPARAGDGGWRSGRPGARAPADSCPGCAGRSAST